MNLTYLGAKEILSQKMFHLFFVDSYDKHDTKSKQQTKILEKEAT